MAMMIGSSTDVEDGSNISDKAMSINIGGAARIRQEHRVVTCRNAAEGWARHSLVEEAIACRKPQITLLVRIQIFRAWSVVRELYHDLVQRKLARMREDTGNEESTKQIGVYQQALTAFMQEDLSEEQLAAAEAIADKWNGMEGTHPPK
ncbi:hypothetical protein BKA82DRAFT_4359858 [Pisolithus tinctorius]|nr:hypothetical protein BKA82DRAFT_4359858 [Pisolithus tinctorius]